MTSTLPLSLVSMHMGSGLAEESVEDLEDHVKKNHAIIFQQPLIDLRNRP